MFLYTPFALTYPGYQSMIIKRLKSVHAQIGHIDPAIIYKLFRLIDSIKQCINKRKRSEGKVHPLRINYPVSTKRRKQKLKAELLYS